MVPDHPLISTQKAPEARSPPYCVQLLQPARHAAPPTLSRREKDARFITVVTTSSNVPLKLSSKAHTLKMHVNNLLMVFNVQNKTFINIFEEHFPVCSYRQLWGRKEHEIV